MYFEDRTFAAKQLAIKLAKYTDDDVIVATLTESSAVLGSVISGLLRSKMTTLISKSITLPGETASLGSVDQTGYFTYSSKLSDGQKDEYAAEYHNYIEAEKITMTHEINREVVLKKLSGREEFTDKIVILVSDGIDDVVLLDSAIEYLKPIRLKRLIIATPVASVTGVDRLHIAADEIHVLSVTENYLGADHYYDDTRSRQS